MRNAFASTIYELAKHDERICVLVADISPAGAMEEFRASFPDRFINVGVAEQAMIGLAAGMAQRGLRPFCYTIATFALFRAYEFIRCDLAYQDLPVTIVGMGAGLSYSTLGGTHQAVEDVAVAMAMPNMTVLAPCDPAETAACARWCAGRESGGPVYMRIGKAGEMDLTADAEPWEFGKLCWLREFAPDGLDDHYAFEQRVLVLSYGPIVSVARDVVARLGPRADLAVASTLMPVPAEVLAADAGYGQIIVIEEVAGAPLGLRVQAACPKSDVQVFALPREFGHIHGTRAQLLDHYGLTAEKIIAQLR